MEYLSREDCELYKKFGGPQDQWPQWYYVELQSFAHEGNEWQFDEQGNHRFIYTWLQEPQWANGSPEGMIRQWLACPHWGDVLTFLRGKGYIISLSLATDCLIVVVSQDDGRVRPYTREKTPVEAVSALIKALAEREGVSDGRTTES